MMSMTYAFRVAPKARSEFPGGLVSLCAHEIAVLFDPSWGGKSATPGSRVRAAHLRCSDCFPARVCCAGQARFRNIGIFSPLRLCDRDRMKRGLFSQPHRKQVSFHRTARSLDIEAHGQSATGYRLP